MYELEYCPELSYGKAAELVSRLAEKGFGVTYKPEYGPEPEYCPEPSYEKAAELVSRLAELGFRQLSTNEQLQEIEELVSKYEGLGVHLQRPAELNEQSDEDFRVKAFAELFNNQKNRVTMQYYVLSDFIARFSSKEAIFWLMQLNSQDQEELINKMYDRMNSIEPHNYRFWIIRKPHSDETREEFIQRRFMKMYNTYIADSLWYDFGLDEAKKYYLAANTDIDEMSLPAPPYAEFWVGMSSIWFQCLPADKQRQHIQVLSTKLADHDDPNQIQSTDTEEDDSRRLTIFRHLFDKLHPRSQRFLMDHIWMTLRDKTPGVPIPCAARNPPDGRSLFDDELIRFNNPHSREGGGGQAPTSPTQGQGGGGSGSGTAAATSTQGGRVGHMTKWISCFFGSSA